MLRSRYYCVYVTILVFISPTLYAESPCKDTTWEFCCSNNRCTRTSYVCDGDDDCLDNSDERSCAGCFRSFSCGDGDCINPVLVCDRTCDCAGNCVDEQECYYDKSTTPLSSTTNVSTTTIMSTTTTRSTSPSYGISPLIIFAFIPPAMILCLVCVGFKRQCSRKPWTAPPVDNEWTPPTADEAPSSNNEWTPPGVNLEADSASLDSTTWQSDLQGNEAPQYYPPHSDQSDYHQQFEQGSNLPPTYNPAFAANGESNYSIYTLPHSTFDVNGQYTNDPDLPPAYESIKPIDVDIEEGEQVPPPNYDETIGEPSAPLEKY